MYLSPRHPDYGKPQQAQAPRAAPEPSGVELLAIDRPGRGRGRDQVLRIALDEFRGSRYLSARIWEVAEDGSTWPTKASLSIRLGEAEDVADAIREGLRLANVVPARLPSSPPERGRRQPEPRGRAGRPASRAERPGGPSLWRADGEPTEFRDDFDEFGGA